MKAKASRRFDQQFKLGAVKLVVDEGKSVPEVAEDLGISHVTLYQWVKKFREHGDDSFPGSGKLMPKDEELDRLRKENRLLKMERDLLKKTMGYFVERPK
jgi:transposase